ncbi:hypothetical protein BP6252_02399 [Coleophoma cylindrospora]|uniref:Uncharacterized protein n=1 Tax=Coleophoma cylindrospora TaxID=1849047 RepID=A0A3D8SEQ6_9HELO|nr:hypothetical protein BP6252_02399 [Coleophoma cylindrospora]
MVDLDNPAGVDLDDDRSIAVRRKRRSSSGLVINSASKIRSADRHGISTPPTTPSRAKKRVRFSDPGPAIQDDFSSGLTPFIRRTSLSAGPKRRHSTPANLSNRAQYDEPLSGTLQFAPLRQVLDGRVKRRLRRNRLSEEINNIESDKRRKAKSRKQEVERLRHELELRDAEMQSMRDEHDLASQLEGEAGSSFTANSRLSSKVEELEQQISDLKAELQQKEESSQWESNDWTMAAQDPFDNNDDDDDFMTTNYDEDFTMNDDEVMTTPTRLKTSFLSPPHSLPNTPSRAPSCSSAGIQADLPILDTEKDSLKQQLEELQSEVSKLNSAIAFKDDNHSRLEDKLAEFIPLDQSHDHSTLDSALDSVLTQLALVQSQALEKEAGFSALSSEISTLGFDSSGPEETIATISKQFRQARLDLEYLTPGENSEGFENSKLLEMLVSRVRGLLKKVKTRDESIDQYHDQEILLRQQINTRVDALQDCQKELDTATVLVTELRTEVNGKEIDNERLKEALVKYRAEVKSLENLVQQIENENKTTKASLEDKVQDEVLKHDITRADNEGKEFLIAELERRLSAALEASAIIQAELQEKDSAIENQKSTISTLQSNGIEREREHGDALALRDSQILSLRTELDSANSALREAHATILSLRRDVSGLEIQVKDERKRGMDIVQRMRQQLSGVLEMGMGYLAGDSPTPRNTHNLVGVNSSPTSIATNGESEGEDGYVRRGGMFDSGSARKASRGLSNITPVTKMRGRRRYDSGLGFLEESEAEEAFGT